MEGPEPAETGTTNPRPKQYSVVGLTKMALGALLLKALRLLRHTVGLIRLMVPVLRLLRAKQTGTRTRGREWDNDLDLYQLSRPECIVL